MAIATTIRRAAFNTNYMGWVNVSLVSGAGVSAATPLTIAGDLVLTPQQELPNLGWKCRITSTPPGCSRLIIRPGDTVTG